MKRTKTAVEPIYIYPLLAILVFVLSVNALARSETFNINYNEADFSFTEDEDGNLLISSFKYPASYQKEEPALPYISTDFAVKGGSKYVSSSFIVNKRLIRSNVTLAQSPTPIPTNAELSTQLKKESTYLPGIYPETNCRYVTISDWGNIATVHFLTCPFVYDSTDKNLYFVDSIELKITTSEQADIGNNRPVNDNASIVKSFVLNKLDVDSLLVKPNPTRALDNDDLNDDLIEYVIITNEKLKSAFEPLAQWKTTKGIRTQILTVNDILFKYQYLDRSYAIKQCLFDLYMKNGLKYVLLGGDDTIVPVKGCYVKVDIVALDTAIPTDMYYGCFDGDISWNSNGNNLYGEENDGQNLASNIFVTRLPVDNNKDVKTFINRLLEYEKNPKYSDSILMSGSNIGDEINIISDNRLMSDAECHGNLIYNQNIQPFWRGKRYTFYDTGNNVSEEMQFGFFPSNLQQQLSKGYSFIDIQTHGSQTYYSMQAKTKYSINYVEQLENCGHTIIATSSCLTNAFDTKEKKKEDDPDLSNSICLSESFIRHPESGIIGYFGSSRYGWGCILENCLGSSEELVGNFFKYLFSPDITQKNFGRIAAAAKASMISQSLFSDSRWTLYSFNPIGDPEMPIFISTPQKFDSAKIIINATDLKIDTGIMDCRICVMSNNDSGSSFYRVYENVKTISLNDFPTDLSICITKQGYVPKQILVKHIQDEVCNYGNLQDYNLVNIGSAVVATKQEDPVIFNDGTYVINSTDVIIHGETLVNNNSELIILSNN